LLTYSQSRFLSKRRGRLAALELASGATDIYSVCAGNVYQSFRELSGIVSTSLKRQAK
ncbi:unnamed protein product, partial [Ceratitis capitata]